MKHARGLIDYAMELPQRSKKTECQVYGNLSPQVSLSPKKFKKNGEIFSNKFFKHKKYIFFKESVKNQVPISIRSILNLQ
jgi:hypothetical protein